MPGNVAQLPVECLTMVQAPMVNVSDLPFRLMCARWGTTLTYTPMYHSTSLLTSRELRDQALLDLQFGRQIIQSPPVVAQLAGNDPLEVLEAGKVLMGWVDALELNLGCPQQAALDRHYGGYLLNQTDLPLVCSIVSHLSSLPLPTHTKIRLPSPSSLLSPLSFSLPLIHAGSRTITLHARPVGAPQRRRSAKGLDTTAVGRLKDGLREAGWCRPKEVGQHGGGGGGDEVRIVGNGGVREWGDVGRLTREEGVEGWMVGEGLVGNPRFFTQDQSGPGAALDLANEYLDLLELYSPCVPLVNVRRHLRSFVEVDLLCARSKHYRPFINSLQTCDKADDFRRLIEQEDLVEAWGTRDRTD